MVKITPAHDFNDYAIGQRHKLPLLNIFTPDAAINDLAPEKYRGLDRYAARKAVLADLEAAGLLVETKPHKLQVPRGDRSGQVIEPYLTDQWFVKMDGLAQRGLELVEGSDGQPGSIRFVPPNWINTYRHWMENIQDWCISRQLWWGHRIPAWYDDAGKIYVGRNEAEVAREALRSPTTIALRQDNDVLETWFSSQLWPFETMGWPDPDAMRERGYDTYLPSSVLVTGFDIIFFWVARMIMATDRLTGTDPVQGRLHHRPGARQGRPEDVEVEGQHPRPARHHRRYRAGGSGRQAHHRTDEAEGRAEDREGHAQGIPRRHPRVRRRRAALHHGRARRATAATSSSTSTAPRATRTSATSCGMRRGSC